MIAHQKNSDIDYMIRALELAHRAEQAGEVPVGALVVLNDTIVGEGWNQPISRNDPSAHAEIMAMRDAGQRLGNYRMPGATLYVTLEPCPMCAGAIIHARIDRLVFGARDPKSGAAGSVFDLLPSDQRFNHYTQVKSVVCAEQCSDLLRDFFRRKRVKQHGD